MKYVWIASYGQGHSGRSDQMSCVGSVPIKLLQYVLAVLVLRCELECWLTVWIAIFKVKATVKVQNLSSLFCAFFLIYNVHMHSKLFLPLHFWWGLKSWLKAFRTRFSISHEPMLNVLVFKVYCSRKLTCHCVSFQDAGSDSDDFMWMCQVMMWKGLQ